MLVVAALVAPSGLVHAVAVTRSAVASSPARGDLPTSVPLSAERPNVLLITTDDQRLSDMRALPATRRLMVRGGVAAGTGLATHPLCCPSRAQFLTGQYAHNNGVRTNAGPRGGYGALRSPDETVARWLHRAGYGTGFVGKFLNGYTAGSRRPLGWSSWNPFVRRTYQAYGVGILDRARIRRMGSAHSNDVVRDYTIRTIGELAGDDPFFVWSSYVSPHGTCEETSNCSDPPVPAVRHRGLYRDARNPAASAPSFRDVRGNPYGSGVQGPLPSTSRLRETNVKRLQALASVDEGIAATFRALRETGELDDTLVVFTSDNGYLLGEHGYLGKNVTYEDALRVPFLVRGPGIAPGATRPGLTAALVDIVPTILAATGAVERRPGPVDGIDLLPFLTGRRPSPSPTQLLEIGPWPAFGTAAQPWTLRGVRTDRYTFVIWQRSRRTQLFDRRRQPHQLLDVSGDSRYREVVRTLRQRLAALEGCAGVRQCRRDLGPVGTPGRVRR